MDKIKELLQAWEIFYFSDFDNRLTNFLGIVQSEQPQERETSFVSSQEGNHFLQEAILLLWLCFTNLFRSVCVCVCVRALTIVTRLASELSGFPPCQVLWLQRCRTALLQGAWWPGLRSAQRAANTLLTPPPIQSRDPLLARLGLRMMLPAYSNLNQGRLMIHTQIWWIS